MIGHRNSVAVAERQAPRSQHTHVPPRCSAVWRNDDVPVHDNLLAFDAAPQRHSAAIAVTFHYFPVLGSDDSVTGRHRLTLVEMHDPESLFVRLLDIVPVGRNPRRILILLFSREAPSRCLEPPLSRRPADQLLTTSCSHRCLEEDFLPLLVP